MNDCPVALFVYRRADTLQKVLECFKADKIPILYVFCDGPKTPEIADEVAKVRQLVAAIDWCDCITQVSDINLGLGVSVKRGVTAVLENHSSTIVFEDDLISVPGTYRYLTAALDHYKDIENVMSVTAWTHPRIIPTDININPYFDGKGECWAWGTWARAWKGMHKPAMDIMEDCRKVGFDLEKYGTDMPKMAAQADRRNLWAIGWWYHHILHNGLCLRPPWSLVEHICWEEERSTTSTPDMNGWSNPPLRSCPPAPTQWPETFEHPACAQLWRTAVDA